MARRGKLLTQLNGARLLSDPRVKTAEWGTPTLKSILKHMKTLKEEVQEANMKMLVGRLKPEWCAVGEWCIKDGWTGPHHHMPVFNKTIVDLPSLTPVDAKDMAREIWTFRLQVISHEGECHKVWVRIQ